jgi:hypothetical protein
VWFYVGEHGNVIREWLLAQNATEPDRSALQALIDICEFSGPDAIRSSTIDLGNGFHALLSKCHGGMELSPVFCRGPFTETEVTFLAGAIWQKKRLKPSYAKGIAEDHLRELRENPSRRVREPVT